VVHGMLVRWSDVASLTRRRGDLTAKPQHSKEEETDPGWAFAQLCRLGLGLVTVGHANLVGLIRIPRPSTHAWNASGDRFLLHLLFGLQPRCPGPTDHLSNAGLGSSRAPQEKFVHVEVTDLALASAHGFP
jgi:hypothetical protein